MKKNELKSVEKVKEEAPVFAFVRCSDLPTYLLPSDLTATYRWISSHLEFFKPSWGSLLNLWFFYISKVLCAEIL